MVTAEVVMVGAAMAVGTSMASVMAVDTLVAAMAVDISAVVMVAGTSVVMAADTSVVMAVDTLPAAMIR